jgi:serine protease Do
MKTSIRWLPVALALLLLAGAAQAQTYVGLGDGQTWYDFGDDGSYLGVYLEELSSGARVALGLDEDQGVLLEKVVEEGPAEKAGIRAGDVLLEVAGRTVNSSRRLSRVLDRYDPEEEVEVIVWRKGERRAFQVTLGKREGFVISSGTWAPEVPDVPSLDRAPTLAAPRVFSSAYGVLAGTGDLGLRTQDLTGQLAEYFEVQRGVLVTWVRRDSPGLRAGVKAGDVITEVEGQPILGEADLRTALSDYRRSEKVILLVVRRGEKLELSVEQ